jgi:hypothetical protein
MPKETGTSTYERIGELLKGLVFLMKSVAAINVNPAYVRREIGRLREANSVFLAHN